MWTHQKHVWGTKTSGSSLHLAFCKSRVCSDGSSTPAPGIH
ncbi:hypothetical protein LEMLEM_LOCUS23003, partial [Lemmus lemmus]